MFFVHLLSSFDSLSLSLFKVLFYKEVLHVICFAALHVICPIPRKAQMGYCYADCYLFKKLKLFLLHQLKPKNNGPHLLFKTIFRH